MGFGGTVAEEGLSAGGRNTVTTGATDVAVNLAGQTGKDAAADQARSAAQLFIAQAFQDLVKDPAFAQNLVKEAAEEKASGSIKDGISKFAKDGAKKVLFQALKNNAGKIVFFGGGTVILGGTALAVKGTGWLEDWYHAVKDGKIKESTVTNADGSVTVWVSFLDRKGNVILGDDKQPISVDTKIEPKAWRDGGRQKFLDSSKQQMEELEAEANKQYETALSAAANGNFADAAAKVFETKDSSGKKEGLIDSITNGHVGGIVSSILGFVGDNKWLGGALGAALIFFVGIPSFSLPMIGAPVAMLALTVGATMLGKAFFGGDVKDIASTVESLKASLTGQAKAPEQQAGLDPELQKKLNATVTNVVNGPTETTPAPATPSVTPPPPVAKPSALPAPKPSVTPAPKNPTSSTMEVSTDKMVAEISPADAHATAITLAMLSQSTKVKPPSAKITGVSASSVKGLGEEVQIS